MKGVRSLLLKIKYFNWHKRLKYKTNILDRAPLLANHQNHITFYDSEEKIEFDFSKIEFTSKDVLPSFISYFSKNTIKLSQPFHICIPNGSLIGHMAVAVFGKNIVLESTHNSIAYLNKTGDAKYLQKKSSALIPNKEIKKAISLVNILSNNYYHWFIDILPTLQPVYDELKKDAKFKIFIRKKAASFQLESLRALGLEENVLEWSSTGESFEKLIVSSYRNTYLETRDFQTDIISKQALIWIRNTFLNQIPITPILGYENIYISRNRAFRRNVTNEHELQPLFDTYGIKKINLEDFSVPEKINLFRQAKRIIAPHGAGITNLLFSDEVKVLELFPENQKYYSSFHQISSHFNHTHFHIKIPSINNDDDMRVDQKQFENILKLIF
ncbi:MAG: glycosyltransferase family 61 protein [Reichenbachiella sp.]|uniref:glycosyltransferase family 61 protein n=1 Tax=Reichenbachiella sp. TaxID=2184521 RepID=UPI003298D34A